MNRNISKWKNTIHGLAYTLGTGTAESKGKQKVPDKPTIRGSESSQIAPRTPVQHFIEKDLSADIRDVVNNTASLGQCKPYAISYTVDLIICIFATRQVTVHSLAQQKCSVLFFCLV